MDQVDGYLQASVGELAELIGVSVRRIQQLEGDQVVESLAHGVYDVAVSVRGYCEFLRSNTLGSESAKTEKVERIRLVKAKAGLAELAHAELAGDLVRAAAIRKQDFTLGRILRNNLESIPDRLAAIVAGEPNADKVHDLIAGEIRTSLDAVLDAMLEAEVDPAALDVTRARARDAIAAADG